MISVVLSIIALVISGLSLVISFIALHRDKYSIQARAVPVQQGSSNTYNLELTVSNEGRRPVSITHVYLVPPPNPHTPGLFLPFALDGDNRIAEFDNKKRVIEPQGLPITWTTADELRLFTIYVEDAVGKRHKAFWEGS